jgi:hypothetical protein
VGLRRRVGWPSALFGLATLALGTQVLLSMSQGLWSLTGELMALALAFALLDARDERPGPAAAAGVAAGFAFLCRPTALLLLPFLAAGGPARRRPMLAAACVPGRQKPGPTFHAVVTCSTPNPTSGGWQPTCIWDEKLARNGRFQVTLGSAEPGPNVDGQYRPQ